MSVVKGYVDHIVYRNQENGYTVLELASDGGTFTLVGILPQAAEGEAMEAEGEFVEHPLYGEQLNVTHYEVTEPQDMQAVQRYLGSGAIKGIGPAMAARIVKKFKMDTLRVIDEEPERLAEVRGISEDGARKIAVQVAEKRDQRQAMMFLQEYGISLRLSAKIYDTYGPELYSLIKTNPYRIADDISGVGFQAADEIARRAGIQPDSDQRIRSGILYTLYRGASAGHVYLPQDVLLGSAENLLGVSAEEMEKHLMDLALDHRIVVEELHGEKAVYAAVYNSLERDTARLLLERDVLCPIDEGRLDTWLARLSMKDGFTLDPLQREAVWEAVQRGVTVITGGPGTGKTTTINTILQYFETLGLDIELAAPTGRAAKRMQETTGYEARTIHRLLEFSGVPDEEGDDRVLFERNENHPLETDVLVIDEMSMVDIRLMNTLLKAVPIGTRLILVGDANQLPSVGPGNVLRDIIRSGCFRVIELTHIFRQDETSDIVVNAHRIHAGEQIDANRRSRDFLFVKRSEASQILSATITLVQKKLPPYVHAKPFDIQVLTPMRKGVLGVENLNKVLQQYLNPPSERKTEKTFSRGTFREGDKVMQIRNDYQIEWEVPGAHGIIAEHGAGIFNGDLGIIREINLFAEELVVEFDERRQVRYRFRQADELELAYAVTVHKSQGSEYPAVVIPVLTGPRMLMNRNLIYTAVTRARTCVCIVGPPASFQAMVDNGTEQRRYSGLDEHLKEILAWNMEGESE